MNLKMNKSLIDMERMEMSYNLAKKLFTEIGYHATSRKNSFLEVK